MRIDDGVHLCRGIEWCDPAASEHDALDAVVGGAVLSEVRAGVGRRRGAPRVRLGTQRAPIPGQVVGHREWPRFATGACDVVAPDHDHEGPCGVVLEGERIEEARQVIGVLRDGEDCEVCGTRSGCPVDTQGLQTRGVADPAQVRRPCSCPRGRRGPAPVHCARTASGIEVEDVRRGWSAGVQGLPARVRRRGPPTVA